MAAYAIQFRRGTTTEHNSFTGLAGEVTVDTDKNTVVVHNGSTAGGYALALEGAAVSTTTGAFSSNVTIGGTLTMSGHVLPSADVTYDLGSASKQWKDIYVGPGSLYVNGRKVIEDDSGSINITTDNNEDLMMSTTGTGTIKLRSANGINLTGELGASSGDIQIGDHIDMNASLIKELGTPVSGTDAANKTYVDTTSGTAVTGGANAGSFTTVTTSGNATIGGNLTVSGTTTYIATEAITLADNILIINSNQTGVPSENGGFEVERGDELNVQFLWNEGDDRWTIGAQNFHSGANITASTLTGDLTGNVAGNLTGNSAGIHTGNVTGDVTGNVTGTVSGSSGTVTSIAAHIKDEDNMASDSATHVPSQQSVKAYVTSQIATKDNTDEMTEGSTNLYYTDARARGAISVSGDMSYNSSTGVISTTGLASSDTDDLAEGSSNLYWTNARGDARITNALKDEDNMSSNSATHVASQQSIKAYVDAVSTAFAAADTADAAAWAAADTAINTAWAAADTALTSSINTAWAAADTAQTNAINIAWAAGDAAVTTAMQTYADTAEADAITTAAATAESKDVARMVTSDAYADAAEAAAIAAAESKDAVRATAANTYADAAVAALVDSAPGTLNTLNELAAALGDDANYASTTTAAIGANTTLANTKLAMAGGTMSGDIAMGGNDITGGGDATFTNFNGTATYAKYADLAERYAADATYEEGTVMMFGGEAEVTSAQGYGSTKIAGVVSTKPGFAMNEEAGNSETHPFIALQGRVPCKVTGTVSKGDILVASEVSGTATKWLEDSVDPRMTAYVGIAIEDKATDGEGYVEVKVGK